MFSVKKLNNFLVFFNSKIVDELSLIYKTDDYLCVTYEDEF